MSTDGHDDLTDDLRRQLAQDGRSLPVDALDAGAVVAHERRRHRRNVIMGSAAAVVLVVGAGWAAASLVLDDRPPSVAIEPLPSVNTPTQEPLPSASPTPSATPSPTATQVPTPVPTPTPGASSTTAPTATDAQTSAPSPSEPAETSTPTATPSPTDTPDDSPAPATVRPGDLVAATLDGIVVHRGGQTRRLPGIDGQVDRAWADGAGGVVFTRNEQGIGRLVDGEITTVVALAGFDPREVQDLDAQESVTIRPRALYLVDVDASAGRMAFAVLSTPDDTSGSTPNDRLTFYESDLDGGARQQVLDNLTFENSSHVALGGQRWLVNAASEGGGALSVAPRGRLDEPLVELDYSFVADDGPTWRGGQLDDGGARLATTARFDGAWQVRLHDVASDTALSTTVAPDGHPVQPEVADLVGQRVVLVGTGDGDPGDSMVLDLATGSTEVVEGWVTIAH